MKVFASLLALFVFGSGLVVGSGHAGAQESPATWFCWQDEVMLEEDVTPLCDVELNKEVSVNGGAFVSADTSEAAAQALIGDTVTWRITVTDMSVGGYQINYELLIDDILPTGVSYVSHVASVGNYDQSQWELPVTVWNEQEQPESALPATLVIQTTAAQVGTWENNAVITSAGCDGWCNYEDENGQNDANSAFVRIVQPTVPQVLGSSTTTTPAATPQVLAATGTVNVLLTILAGIGIAGLTVVLRRRVAVPVRAFRKRQ